ncbi:MAG: hypothetical protein LAQ69_15215 [Acidobacteriia bacterium]|nr:hypothetical protein [Terriglobia bacterium]
MESTDEKANGAWYRLTGLASRLIPQFGKDGAFREACLQYPALAGVAIDPNGQRVTTAAHVAGKPAGAGLSVGVLTALVHIRADRERLDAASQSPVLMEPVFTFAEEMTAAQTSPLVKACEAIRDAQQERV